MRPLHLLLTLVGVVAISCGAAPLQNLETFYNGEIQEYVRLNANFFVASCTEDKGIAIIAFPVGQTAGFYAEFSENGSQANSAKVSFPKGNLEVGELMFGGIGTLSVQKRIIISLIRASFLLIHSSDLKEFLVKLPKNSCS